jgi:hypothetical protein
VQDKGKGYEDHACARYPGLFLPRMTSPHPEQQQCTDIDYSQSACE